MTGADQAITAAGLAAAGLHLLIVLAIGLRVLTRRRPPGSTAGWLLLIVVLPYGGALLYLLIGERPMGRQRARRAQLMKAQAEHWLADLAGRSGTLSPGAIDNWHGIRRLADRAVGIQALAGNQLQLLDDTGQVLRAMIADIQQARHFCLLEFYIWNPGGAADDVAEALLAAAGRGVTCRVLLDDVGSGAFFKSDWPQRFRAAGIELHRALPANVLRAMFRRVDLRLHRKLLVVDGHIAYTGSLNLVDPRYFKQGAGVGEWIDAMVRVRGPAVAALAGLFAWDWALETDASMELAMQQVEVPVALDAGPAAVQMVPSGPGYEGHGVVQLLLAAVYAAGHELTLTTPYFIPDDPLVEALRTAAMRGVRVRLVLPAKVDSHMVQHASRAYFDELLEAGVEIHLFDGGLLHTKSVVVDRELAFFGTLNLDIRSFQLNFELTLLVYDAQFGARMVALTDRYIANSGRLTREQWDQRPTSKRLTENLFQLMSPLL
jgi:cardiolipin synthase